MSKQKRHIKFSLFKKSGCVLAFVLFLTIFSYAQAPSKEYQLKAVFLFNFSQFTEWPDNAFPAGNSPFVIGILGNDPFGNYLSETVSGEKKAGHPIIVKRFQSVKDVSDCDILFVSSSEKTKEVADGLGNKNILTVGDSNDFATSGGMIQFFTDGGKIRFKINLNNVKNAGLSISSKLLRLAQIVQ